MKGITAFMLEILLLLLAIGLFIIFLGPTLRVFATEKPSTSTPPMFSSSTTTFDYSTYLLDTKPVDANEYDNYNSDLCKKLKKALKYAVMTGRPYKVDEIAYGYDLYNKVLFDGYKNNFPFIGNCNDEVLETEIANGLNQSVCSFVKTNINQYDPLSRTFPYGGISDAARLDFNNCFYEKISYNSLFSSYIGSDEELNHNADIVNLLYSPDYLYIKNGDYSHYPNMVNFAVFDNAYNGAGRLQIYVGDAQSKDGDCVFNIYFCPRPAIAISTQNSTIDIFNLLKDFELASLRFEFRPYYINDLTDSASTMNTIILLPHLGFISTEFSKKVYYWNYYDVKLDGDYDVSTILNAIKEGLYLNVYGKDWFFAQPHWDVTKDISIDKDRECWSKSYDTIINSGSASARTRSIRFNCGDDNICSSTLRIKIAMRLDNKTADINADGNNEELDYISGFVSFCEEGSVGRYCGDNVVDVSGEQCDCGTTNDCTDEGGGDLGGTPTCESLGYQSGTLGCTSDCNYDESKCVPFPCGNNRREGKEKCDCGTTNDCTDEGGGDLDTPAKTCADLGYSPTCADMCIDGKEYKGGSGGGVGTLKCYPSGSNGCTFDTSSCLTCAYASVKDCMFACSSDNINCSAGSWCPSTTCTGRLDFGCSGSGTQCTTTAKCAYSFPVDYPICTYSDTYRPWVCNTNTQWGCDPNYTCIGGWFNCCTDTNTVCVQTSCSYDEANCKYA